MNDAADAAADDRGLQQALVHLQSVLISGETCEAWSVQRRLFALGHRRALVAATSGRLIGITRRLLGGFDVTDLRWQDLENVGLRVGLFGADLTLRVGGAADLASAGAKDGRLVEFRGLRKESAQAVYRICQAQDQAWREKRRIRELEELRARSGGIQLAGLASNSTAYSSSGAAVPESMRRLQEAKQMLEAKLITDAEYESIKAKIVSQP